MALFPVKPAVAISAALITGLLSLWVPTASAAIRSGSIADPEDTLPVLSGSRNPDISSVVATYDESGTLSVSISLYQAFSQTSKSDPYLSVGIGSSDTGPSGGYRCGATNDGDVLLGGGLDPSQTYAGIGVSIFGYQGELPVTRTFSADGLTTTFSATAPQLANRNYRCVDLAELSHPDKYGHCGNASCSYIAYSYIGDTTAGFFFSGFEPAKVQCSDGIDNDGDGRVDTDDPDCNYSSAGTSEGQPKPPAAPATACGDGVDNDGDGVTDTDDPGCYGESSGNSEVDPARRSSRTRITSLKATSACEIDVESEVTPDIHPLDLFPFKKITLRVSGIAGPGTGYRKTRQLPLGLSRGYGFAHLKPGRYRVEMSYPGDRWRKKSTARARTIRVC